MDAAPIVFLQTQRGLDWPQAVCTALGRAGLVYSRRGYSQSAPMPESLPADYMQREAWEALPALLHRRSATSLIEPTGAVTDFLQAAA